MNAMIRRYYLFMLSPTVLALIVVLLAVAAAPDLRLQHVPYAILSLGLIMVPLILIGSYFLFSPIAHDLDGRGNFGQEQRRVRRLPLLSAGWTFILALIWGQPMFYFESVFCDGCGGDSLPVPMLHPLLLNAVYAGYLGTYIYFLINDYTLSLRQELFRQSGIVIEPHGGRLLYKLALAFVATAMIPASLVFLDTFLLGDLRELQGLTTTQALQIDIMGAVVLVGIITVFIVRSLTRPVGNLLTSMQQVHQGNLESKVPVLSDDEIGTLTLRFDEMVEGLKDRNFIRQTFSRFVPESVVDTVLKDRGVVHPQSREATILFTDIAGFSTICEQLQPEQIITMLNEYFTTMAEPIHQYGGVITQFQGDAMLVSFNLPVEDPDHAANAVRAARALQQIDANHRFLSGITLNTRVGISTGHVVGGTVGDADRLGYTVHGDEVNLAARLEQLNKEYGTRVLVAERTVELAGNDFGFRQIGEVTVRGRQTPVTVYELPVESAS
ncbi:MAG: HAMP domain-containing protein [Gammaproteobacteria bacterium]|nr:HAMP domain-containing protein [Gammaproteobacteria bacterium]